MEERKTFISSLIVALPEALGYLDVYAHITVNGKTFDIQAKHFSRWISCNTQSWPTLYLCNSNRPVVVENDLSTSCFKVEMEFYKKIYLCNPPPTTFYKKMEGEYYFTVIAWKDSTPTYYYTEKRYFQIGYYY